MNGELEFSALDQQFGQFLERLDGGAAPEVNLAAKCASRARAAGHICVTVKEIAGFEGAPTPTTLRKKLRASRVVGEPGEFTPLVLDKHDRLYLRRYWEYEQQLAQAILRRANGHSSAAAKDENDLQQLAAARAVANNFTVITGGPGTGKTRTVMAILTLLYKEPNGENLRIALAAPTGKAAARLTESVREVNQTLKATTLHRLLGYMPNSPYFRHNAEHRLNADVVIVDEASMIDLALMAKLINAVRPEARLILLGDRDQLASVEAGSVLADICAAAESAQPNDPLFGGVVALQHNYRFASTGGIYQVSAAVNSGDAEEAVAAFKKHSDARWQALPDAAKLSSGLRDRLVAEFRPCLETDDPVEALARLQRFRILCALRHGPFGVESLNAIAEEILAEAGVLNPRPGTAYRGQPLTIIENNYNLGLFNGDSGIILADPEDDGELRTFFISAEGKLRRFLPSRLPRHETAFATTVHKSQGSEFARVLLILPDFDAPILTRELLYTGLTRAREQVEVWAPETVLRAAISRRVTRASGLREALGQKSS
jgi:exodeoxyribonuclease V alpha subunit